MYPTEVQTNLILEFDRWTGCYLHVQGDVLGSIDLQFHPPTSLTRKIASGLLGQLGCRSQYALAIRFHELKQLRMENGLNTELAPF